MKCIGPEPFLCPPLLGASLAENPITALTGIAPDIVFVGDLASTVNGETLTPTGATAGNARDRTTLDLTDAVLDTMYRFGAIGHSLAAANAEAIQPGDGNFLWSFLLRLDAGVNRVGDIASNTDGTTGWRLAWNGASQLTAFVTGPVIATVASTGAEGLSDSIWHMCSILANRTTGRLYVVDDWTTRVRAEASSVAIPAGSWDNPGIFAIGAGASVSFSGWDCAGAFRWTGEQLDGYDGPQLVEHHAKLRSRTIAGDARVRLDNAAAHERVTNQITAPTGSASVFQTTDTGFVAAANTPIVPPMWDIVPVFVDDLPYLGSESDRITVIDSNIIRLPPAQQGRFQGFVNIGLSSSQSNHSVTLLMEIGVGFSTTPGDGTILFAFVAEASAGVQNSVFNFNLSTMGRLTAGGPDLDYRFTFASSVAATFTFDTRVANITRESA